MYSYTSTDQPNQQYRELLRAADNDRLARQIVREQRATRRAARRRDRQAVAIRPVVRPA
ncbi:hypothetical protein [Microlunatus parietis]|uniref:Uncharacterized protein n=1 Tax=Microlunatus parietis TaxID=682979 RepID=A0A7Y9I7R2_9ACTN|nr:hypothetical protein [Microlunatus parietis]NYE71541.1 hypothetical protein [Microlunatus parietis]